MDRFSVKVKPQFVALTEEKETFPNGQVCFLHEFQKRMKLDFEGFSEFTIITAPTGTGKSYAFPFPVINAKKKSKPFEEGRIRGLIVLPTNTLIDELSENFSKTYPFLNVKKITGRTLDELAVKGFDRWSKVNELCKGDTDLVITNPDIINYAMHGGYHKNAWQNTGRNNFYNFLEYFGYIIFDEYHLYDESQIANLFTLIYLRDIFLQENNKIKFFFVSATPEKALKNLLINKGYKVEEVIEGVVGNADNSRAIHGLINVEFCSTLNQFALINEYKSEIKDIIDSGKRVLIVLDKLNEVQLLSDDLANKFPESVIYQSTGYIQNAENQQRKIHEANIIVATNKAEVGVNYNVEYCIMQPGKYYQNFVQRFGRIARGYLEGKVVVNMDNVKYNSIKRVLNGYKEVNYYDFLEKIRSVIQSKKFYSERVLYYIGEYIWCIEKKLKKQKGAYHTFQYFKTRLNEENFFKNAEAYSRYKLFSEIDKLIYSLNKAFPDGTRSKAWAEWWNNYLNTFLRFRDNSIVVQIIDKQLNIEVLYSLEWILQYKEILNIEEIDCNTYTIRQYTVGKLKERDKDIQYVVNTIPSIGAKENEFLSPKEIFDLPRVFEKRIGVIIDRNRRGVDEINIKQIELLGKVKLLSQTFDRKRLSIIDIANNDNFI
ncbi:MAG: type I-D CRISPR-associated helicase Cas3' [Bacteroidales bacterium]|nr:type I-D CRISPR-associated helicase Cas3' [Bacteroidales bacterium]MDD4581440.1 type I-D CRISPR-associated helicase Cas3' [Bacteroidales bacterium]